ncbi:hypothetical protein PSHT_14824 [Puccinia striiformis]|uniref:Uncharacterized protein n=1 Tax=Puccinia striiformis TaxID=27350 RepID=A0A2S4UIB6_9BASI|nr:hypothetical protein PSHT_14824 [Puccinia striiformis]
MSSPHVDRPRSLKHPLKRDWPRHNLHPPTITPSLNSSSVTTFVTDPPPQRPPKRPKITSISGQNRSMLPIVLEGYSPQ